MLPPLIERVWLPAPRDGEWSWLARADHNFEPEWSGRWVRWGADLDELIEPDLDGRLEQAEARACEQVARILARR
jgi:hypothetical protein